MKVSMHVIAELSAWEAERIIPRIRRIIGGAELSIDSHIRIKLVEQSKGGNNFLDLPSKTDSREIKESLGSLSKWYRSEMFLSVRASNALAKADIFPRELAEMLNHQILEIKEIGEIGCAQIRRELDRYLS